MSYFKSNLKVTSYDICLSPSDFLSMILSRSISVAANGIMSFSFFGYAVAPKACGILVPQLGIEPGPLTVKAPRPTYWATSEFLHFFFFLMFWLHWVFIAVRGLSVVAASEGYSRVAVQGLLTAAASLVAEHRF